MVLLLNILLLVGLVMMTIGFIRTCKYAIECALKRYVGGSLGSRIKYTKYCMILGAVMALGAILILMIKYGVDAIIIKKIHLIISTLGIEVLHVFRNKNVHNPTRKSKKDKSISD